MTNQGEASGSSLFQARSSSTRHNHNLNHKHQHQHLHHQHRRLHPPEADGISPESPHIRSEPNGKLYDRQVVIVQTVSIVHYIDASGAVTSIETLRSKSADPVASTSLDLPAAVSAGLTALDNVLPSVSLSISIPAVSDAAPSTTTSAEPETSSSLSTSSETLTSAPFSSLSAFPTLSSGTVNSSSQSASFFGNHTIGLFSNSTRTSSSHSTLVSTSTSSLITSSSSLLTPTATSDDAFTTEAGGIGDGATVGVGSPVTTSAPVSPTTEASSGLTPQTRNAVVGGVVGSVAGIALIALVLLYLLKWRKQRGQGIMLLGDGDSSARRRGFSSGGSAQPGGGGRGGGGGMTERSGPFAIASSALSRLSGGKRSIDASRQPATEEKGFYRVSGRKLISVLESGGDGYSDPPSDFGKYRDSQGYLDDPNAPPLQLGSPMRPLSGIPIFRDGPQRSPVHEQGPSPAGRPPSAYPTMLPVRDALGRSSASRDGSRGSVSRFTEET
ncbi:hypothetical protein C8A03DRAFT_29553 [Achaetomium macrosporum]|uniref:Uncharacterized protein n=1 Tax=Achaetomium macrosporum TaxID=79813 RepID=A0AAN7CI88_9PEZI|nr:hypothetical protein C8A03DRAFT_29553 [Achaetomium macrosporum]